MGWLLALGPPASAAPIHVNCGTGGNLQDKIDATPGGSTILIKGTCDGQFSVTGKALTLKGDPTATLDGQGAGTTLSIDATGKTIHLVNLVVTNGGGTTRGGGIWLNNGNLTLLRTTVSANEATSDDQADGGGIWANTGSQLTLTSSKVTGNKAIGIAPNASPHADGGGIWSGGTVTLDHSVVSGNMAVATSANHSPIAFGGGIEADGGVTLTNSTVSGNTAKATSGVDIAGAYGGGVVTTSLDMTASKLRGNVASAKSNSSSAFADGGGAFMASGDATLVGGGILGNMAKANGDQAQTLGGGIDMGGALTLQHASLNGNQAVTTAMGASAGAFGGGAYVDHASVFLTRSTVGRNVASATSNDTDATAGGGAIDAEGAVMATNSTISSNQASATSGGSGTFATVHGGAVESGEVDLVFATVAANGAIASADNVTTDGGGFKTLTLNATASIVAGNHAATGPDCDANASTSHGYNLVSHTVLCLGSPKPTDVTGKPAVLGKLKANGGPTQTMAPSAASPAVDVIPNAACTVAGDQRGSPRPGGGPKCDIGAFERQ